MGNSERFHYPVEDAFTGRVQFAIDRHGSALIKSGDKVYGTVLRGEVVEVKEGLARSLVVRGGNFAHVAADTPFGQPDEYKAAAKTEAPAPVIAPTDDEG